MKKHSLILRTFDSHTELEKSWIKQTNNRTTFFIPLIVTTVGVEHIS